jgi:TonB family protein
MHMRLPKRAGQAGHDACFRFLRALATTLRLGETIVMSYKFAALGMAMGALSLAVPARAADPVFAGGTPIGQHEAAIYYPPEAQRAGESGEVIVEEVVGPDGSVREALVAVSSGYFDLDDAAVTAVKSWRYTPPTRDGAPTSMRRLAKVDFNLGANNFLTIDSEDAADCRNSTLTTDQRIGACGRVIKGLLTTHHGEISALKVRSSLYVLLHKEDLARADFDALLKLDPNDGPTWYSRGVLSYSQKKYDLAVADLAQAKRLAPRFFYAYYFSALANMERRDFVSELSDLDAALAMRAGELYLVCLRTLADRQLGHHDAVVADANRVIALKPDFGWAYSMRALGHMGLRDTDAALADAAKAIALDPKSPDAYYTRVLILFAARRIEEALPDLDKLLAMAGDNVLYRAMRGDAYDYLKQYDRALAEYDAALAIKADDPGALNGRCFVRAETGSGLDLALADCNRSLALAPGVPRVLDSRGFVYFRMGDNAKAIADFDAALAKAPKLAASLYIRGLAKQKSGDDAGGKADIAAALAIDPKVAEVYRGYGIKP